MKFAISGAHGQGKTTTLKYLIPLLDMQYSIITNQTRQLRSRFGINEAATDDTQREILGIARNVAALPLPLVADRCGWDTAAYTWALHERGQVSRYILHEVEDNLNWIAKQYHKIFYLPPVLKLVDDGVRSLDVGFFNDVVKGFERYRPDNVFDIPPSFITPQQRADLIAQVIKGEKYE